MPALVQQSLNGTAIEYALLNPSADQWTTIYIIIGYVVGILVFWNVKYLKEFLLPFKIVTVVLHEFGHASAGCCTGAKIHSIEVNPDEGGATRMSGGNPYCTLPAGYIGSSVWGSLMVFAGFNILASKIVGVIVGVAMLMTLYWAKNNLTRILTILFAGLIGFLFWFQDGIGLRYFVLFMGVMSCMYSLWDIVEDLISRKVNESDASQFAKLCCGGCIPSQVWGLVWFIISCAFLIGAIVVALLVFRETK